MPQRWVSEEQSSVRRGQQLTQKTWNQEKKVLRGLFLAIQSQCEVSTEHPENWIFILTVLKNGVISPCLKSSRP